MRRRGLRADAALPRRARLQPGFIIVIERLYWRSAKSRTQQRRRETEDGFSWLSSSSTRPSVVSLPTGEKLVTEYLYRRDRSQATDALSSLQKHEMWLLPADYELIARAPPGARASHANARRPSTPMPVRCLVHYLCKQMATWKMAVPRVRQVPLPRATCTNRDELALMKYGVLGQRPGEDVAAAACSASASGAEGGGCQCITVRAAPSLSSPCWWAVQDESVEPSETDIVRALLDI